MKQYFTNLFRALLGRNPYQMELDALREQYDKTVERVQELNEYYFKSVEKFDETNKQMLGCQKLIENLRGHLAECQEQIDEYRRENTRLRGLLQGKEGV